jgi:hypothetical protein
MSMRSSLLFGALLVFPPAAGAQTVCRQADTLSAKMIGELARYSSTTDRHDAVVRDSLRLPSVPANQVQLVTQESVCKKANAAYQASNSSYGTGFRERCMWSK